MTSTVGDLRYSVSGPAPGLRDCMARGVSCFQHERTIHGQAKQSSDRQDLCPSINIGISDKDRAAIAQGLSRLLADTYTP